MADVEKQVLLPKSPENVPAGDPLCLSACFQAYCLTSVPIFGRVRAQPVADWRSCP